MKLEDAITEYLQHCENRQLDKKTIKAYRIDLTFFLKYAKEINMHTTTEITVDAIKDLIADWYKQERESTAYRRSASVRAFLKYLWEMDYTESNLYEKTKLKIKGVKYDAPDILSVKEIQHLFDGLYRQYSYAETDFQKLCGLRNIVLVEMLCFAGVRISEICSFRRENISFLSSAYIIQVKGYRERTVCIEDKTAADNLRLYCDTFKNQIEQTEYLFFNRFGKQLSEQSIRRIVNNTTEIIGISKKVTPKMLRDTLAGNMLKQNYSVRQLQSFLGDKSLMTTEKRAKTIEMGNIQVFNPVSVYL